MSLILGIETSCDETAAAVYDATHKIILASHLFSQIKLHEIYGGIVPEIASRSQLEKIDLIIKHTLLSANVDLNNIDAIAVTNKPGLAGSLLVGTCFAKAIAWVCSKKIMGINHLEAHIFSAFLQNDDSVNPNIKFPFLSLTASGGHTAMYLVKDFGDYECIGRTEDDAAGELFDKIAKILGFGYPGGALIEKLASQVNFQDFIKYTRTKPRDGQVFFSFSGLKTAVLYDLVKKNAYDLQLGPIKKNMTLELQQQVSSSLLTCVADIFENNVKLAFKKYPEATCLTFAGGVACNQFLRHRLSRVCGKIQKHFYSPPPKYCSDNGSMIAFVGAYKADQNKFDDLTLDILG
jgi:N6-L-threonylcarbamoyladenine synthase